MGDPKTQNEKAAARRVVITPSGKSVNPMAKIGKK